jgi:phosphate transport system substrate-binding protein
MAMLLISRLAQLENKAGRFIAPDEPSGQSALAESVTGTAPGAGSTLEDPTNPTSYPIVTYSWLLLYRQNAAEKRDALKAFIGWGLAAGQSMSSDLGFIPLPGVVISRARTALDDLR